MAKLKGGTRIYGTAIVDTSIAVGSAVTANSSGIQVTGIVTATSFSGNASSATYATNAGIATNVIGGIGSLSQLQVSGVSTFSNGPVLIGSGTSTGTSGQVLQIAGINSSVYIGGNIGIGTTNPTSKLWVTGDGYFTGVVTANSFRGDGSLLTGITATASVSISTNTTNINQFIPFATSFGSTTGFGATTLLVYNPSSGNLGIGTTNPTSRLTVQGDVRVSGVVTATQLDLTASATASDSVLYLSGTPTSSSGTNGLLGIGALNFSDTDIVANFTHSVNSYAQVILQNKNSGSTASADFIVNNDRTGGTAYYGDFGINATTFSGVSPFNDPDGVYVISSNGSLTLGSITLNPVKIATNNVERLRVTETGNIGIGTTIPSHTLHVQGDVRITGAFRDSTNSPGTTGQVLQSTGNGTGTQWTTASASAGGGGSGKFDTTIDNVLYVQPTGTLDIVGVGTTTTQITTLPASPPEYIIHSLHVTNISNGDAEITAGFVMNARKVPATISVSVGSSGGPGIHTFTVGSASSIRVGMAVTGTGNIGETTGIGTTAGFQFNTYVTSVDGNNITLNKPMSGRATGTLFFSPVSLVSSRLPVPVGSAVELLKQPMVLNALDSIVLQSTGAGSGIGTTSTNTITYTSGRAALTVTNQAASFFNSIAIGNLVQNTGVSTGIQPNTYVGASYTGISTSYAGTGVISIPITRPVNATVGVATALSFTEVVVPQDGALQVTVVYQSSTDTSYQNGTGTVVGIVTLASLASSRELGITSTTPSVYYGTGNVYPSIIQSIRVSNISDSIIYPGGDYPVSVGIGNSDTIFSWLAYNMVIPRNSSIELCEAPKRIGIGQSIFAFSNTPNAIEIQVAGKQKTS